MSALEFALAAPLDYLCCSARTHMYPNFCSIAVVAIVWMWPYRKSRFSVSVVTTCRYIQGEIFTEIHQTWSCEWCWMCHSFKHRVVEFKCTSESHCCIHLAVLTAHCYTRGKLWKCSLHTYIAMHMHWYAYHKVWNGDIPGCPTLKFTVKSANIVIHVSSSIFWCCIHCFHFMCGVIWDTPT